jgi:hypothetical protein
MTFIRRSPIAIAIALAILLAPVVKAQAAPSLDPWVDVNQASPSPIHWQRGPSTIQLSTGARVLLTDLVWALWTPAGLTSVGVASGTEEKWQCPNQSNCPMTGGSGGYVDYPVNVMLEWPDLTSQGYTFTTMVISSPTLGTHAQRLFF